MTANNTHVKIGGKQYRFSCEIEREPALFESFNALANETFSIRFQSVGGDYMPYVLADGDTVCANVSVNRIPFLDHGTRKFYIQLGIVMTKKEYRNKGLGRWLMEEASGQWQSRCHAVYLFANDSVLDFYPKFGFAQQDEFEYVYTGPRVQGIGIRKLSMKNPLDKKMVFTKYEEGNPFSAFSMIENRSIFDFYAKGLYQDAIYALEPFGVIAFLEVHDGATHCYDLFGKTEHGLVEILQAFPQGWGGEIILGFPPKDTSAFTARVHKEEDTTLFIHSQGENRFLGVKEMFPVLSHA